MSEFTCLKWKEEGIFESTNRAFDILGVLIFLAILVVIVGERELPMDSRSCLG